MHILLNELKQGLNTLRIDITDLIIKHILSNIYVFILTGATGIH